MDPILGEATPFAHENKMGVYHPTPTEVGTQKVATKTRSPGPDVAAPH
jgi:hypothetical protein